MPVAHACSFPAKFCHGLTKSCSKCAFYFLNYNNDYARLYSYYPALFTWNQPFIFLPLIYDYDRHIHLTFANLTETFPFLPSFQGIHQLLTLPSRNIVSLLAAILTSPKRTKEHWHNPGPRHSSLHPFRRTKHQSVPHFK